MKRADIVSGLKLTSECYYKLLYKSLKAAKEYMVNIAKHEDL